MIRYKCPIIDEWFLEEDPISITLSLGIVDQMGIPIDKKIYISKKGADKITREAQGMTLCDLCDAPHEGEYRKAVVKVSLMDQVFHLCGRHEKYLDESIAMWKNIK